MINNDYLVDMSWCDSGGYCDFMPIRGEDFPNRLYLNWFIYGFINNNW
jgi:hypothetical protein